MPVDIIKIDRSFIRDIASDPADASMIRAMLQMANAFGLETVAEGVESAEQISFLKDAGCDVLQGFFFNKALPINEVVAWMNERRR